MTSQFVLSRPGSPLLGKLSELANGQGDDLINRLEATADEM